MTVFAAVFAALPAFLYDPVFWLVVIIGLAAFLFFGVVILLKANYKRCSSNQVLVIFGRTTKGEAAKTVHGGAAFVCRCFKTTAT